MFYILWLNMQPYNNKNIMALKFLSNPSSWRRLTRYSRTRRLGTMSRFAHFHFGKPDWKEKVKNKKGGKLHFLEAKHDKLQTLLGSNESVAGAVQQAFEVDDVFNGHPLSCSVSTMEKCHRYSSSHWLVLVLIVLLVVLVLLVLLSCWAMLSPPSRWPPGKMRICKRTVWIILIS